MYREGDSTKIACNVIICYTAAKDFLLSGMASWWISSYFFRSRDHLYALVWVWFFCIWCDLPVLGMYVTWILNFVHCINLGEFELVRCTNFVPCTKTNNCRVQNFYSAVVNFIPCSNTDLLHIQDAAYTFSTAPFSSRPGGRVQRVHWPEKYVVMCHLRSTLFHPVPF